MNDINNTERNEQMVRIMAVVGFVVLICLLAWLAVQVVRFVPVVFSSLADVFEENQRDYAENVNRDDDENIVVVMDNTETIDEEPVIEDEVIVEEEPVVDTTDPSVVTGDTPVVTTPAPIQYKTVTTYKKPVSNPNGFTDLSMSFVSVGNLNSNQRFVPGTLPDNGQGAMQFIVKNLGTKTSSDWNFKLDLPNGSTMTSSVQKPLMPNESSTLTVVFEMDKDWHNIGGTVLGGGDVNLANNSFTAKVAKR
ncbi:hypothetical protein H6788_02515 [Candidatus Nomurabacteria bacterium]|nr:hypothetical protein [Candidatus Nomurabacteria bacterium]